MSKDESIYFFLPLLGDWKGWKGLMADPRCRFLTKIKYYHKKLYETLMGFQWSATNLREKQAE